MIGDLDTMSESHRKDKGSRHDAGEPRKIGNLDTIPESRRNDRGSGHDAGEPPKRQGT